MPVAQTRELNRGVHLLNGVHRNLAPHALLLQEGLTPLSLPEGRPVTIALRQMPASETVASPFVAQRRFRY